MLTISSLVFVLNLFQVTHIRRIAPPAWHPPQTLTCANVDCVPGLYCLMERGKPVCKPKK